MSQEDKDIIKELNRIRFETERDKCILYASSLGRADLSKFEKRIKILDEIEKIINQKTKS